MQQRKARLYFTWRKARAHMTSVDQNSLVHEALQAKQTSSCQTIPTEECPPPLIHRHSQLPAQHSLSILPISRQKPPPRESSRTTSHLQPDYRRTCSSNPLSREGRTRPFCSTSSTTATLLCDLAPQPQPWLKQLLLHTRLPRCLRGPKVRITIDSQLQ